MKSILYILLLCTVYALENIRCINYYGFETPFKNLVCSWKNDPEFYLRKLITEMHINTIRLPFSYEYITGNDLSRMDSMISLCRDLNINVILDWHRTWSSHQGAIPEEGITLDIFISAWMNLLDRFKGYHNVVGVGIFNEIQLNNDFAYANNLHTQVITMLEQQFPDRFYYFAGCPSWGGNCSDMHLESLPVWNRTFIEVHKYRFSGRSDRADWDISIPNRIPYNHWFIGEVGWKQEDDRDTTWGMGFMQYLQQRNITNVCLWTIAHSGDTNGWFNDDCMTFNKPKADIIMQSIWKNTTATMKKLHLRKKEKWPIIDIDGLLNPPRPPYTVPPDTTWNHPLSYIPTFGS